MIRPGETAVNKTPRNCSPTIYNFFYEVRTALSKSYVLHKCNIAFVFGLNGISSPQGMFQACLVSFLMLRCEAVASVGLYMAGGEVLLV